MKTPETLEDCFLFLSAMLNKGKIKIAADNPEFGVGIHHTLGRQLRNEWGLWSGGPLKDFFNGIGIYHADDMSGIIFTSYHRHLNGEDLKLDEQVKYYQEYWTRQQEEDELSLLYSKDEVDDAIHDLVDEINNVKNANWVFIMILKGGVYLGMRLLRELDEDIPYGFIGLNSYAGESTVSSKRIQCTYKPLFPPDFLEGKDILLVDDVLESGATLEYAKQMFANTGYRSIKGVVLVRKNDVYPMDTCLWIRGFVYSGDSFIVGCGLGLGEKYRSLQCIYVYEER